MNMIPETDRNQRALGTMSTGEQIPNTTKSRSKAYGLNTNYLMVPLRIIYTHGLMLGSVQDSETRS